jgi:hypothetical protein
MPTAVLYTTTDNIRAALGVSIKEIADAQITDASIADQITVKLASLYPTHATLATDNGFPSGPAPGGHPTADEAFTWIVLKLFCMYYGAELLLAAAQTLLAQTITDGQSSQARFQSDDLDETIDRIGSRADYYAGILNPDYSAEKGLGFALLGVVTPTYNPVTGCPPKIEGPIFPWMYPAIVQGDILLLENYGLWI